MKRRSPKFQAMFRLIAAVAIIVLLNFVGAQYFTRIDLTKEKRYSLSTTTKQLLNGVDDIVFVKVYLEGDFPAHYKRLRNTVKETLDDFGSYARENIEYVFINPSEGTEEERDSMVMDLVTKGLVPVPIIDEQEGTYSQQMIFPGAVFSYHGREVPVQLLENMVGYGEQEMVNNSIELLEYKFANSIRKLLRTSRPRVLFTRGQGELQDEYIADIMRTLNEQQYSVGTINLQQELIPSTADILLVAKPTLPFSEKEKFKIDQFIMYGGRVLWLVDAMNAELDSLQAKTVYLSQPYALNLEDQLFKYGVRLNTDLVQDLRCASIPLLTSMSGNQSQPRLFPWYYYPLVVSNEEHAIVKNLDAVLYRFTGSIDFVGRDSARVNKIPLLHSSGNSKALLSPVRLHFSMLQAPPDTGTFNQNNLVLGALLEGTFESVFKNRVAESFAAGLDSLNQPFKEESDFTKMIVIPDGDVIKNDVMWYPNEKPRILPLGSYRYTQQIFSNRDFILNCIEHLADDIRLIETRNKQVDLRLLDMPRVKKETAKWQVINVAVPLVVIAMCGVVFNWIRRRRYAR